MSTDDKKPSAVDAFDELAHRVTRVKSAASCAAATLQACDSITADTDVGHAETLLRDVIDNIERVQIDMEAFERDHIRGAKLRAVQS